MLDKLRIVKQRYDEVSDLIIQPEIIMDQKRYAQLMKEYKDLGNVVEKGAEYQALVDNIEEAKEILADGSDAEMNEMAKSEIDEANARIPKLEEEIRFLLIPTDPEELGETRQVFSLEICFECILNIVKVKVGRSLQLITLKAPMGVLRKFSLK